MRGVYTAIAKVPGITSAGTLAYLTAPSGKVLELISLSVTNESNATNFQQSIALQDISTLGSPANYSQYTPVAHEPGDQAAGGTFFAATGNSRTEPSAYGNVRTQEGSTSLIGYRHEPQPDERILIGSGKSLGVKLNTAPGSSTDYDVRATWREIG